ncbi:MAG: VIT1/CCC1 transporter family protein [Alphaproteobacteria bacterium]|nr:VIT1/CCC1 transporter family protein [Alphaproteobacteria bacterium]
MAHVEERWRSEKNSAWLYEVVAAAESDPAKTKLFRDLGVAAEKQAAILAGDLGGAPPLFRPSLRMRTIAALVRLVGPRAARPVLAAAKVRGISVYSAPAVAGHTMPTSVAGIGGRHRGAGGGALRAGVFGVNDGLVSSACLIFGVAGAGAEPNIIVLTGVAGLLAGAFSMAAGEYLSMLSQREMFEHQIGEERDELERYPAEEAEELALIYAARGIPIEEARGIAKRLIANPKQALDTLAREELGLNPDDLGSPWGAAISSFAAFAVGAMLPLAPFLLGGGPLALPIAVGVTGAALFAVGAALSLFSGRNAVFGGLRMLLIGALAGGATFGIGQLLGVGVA